ncbi:MAG: UxaA family hydrolase [Firmicutes bacterium]|nr:UxaA family hydrolase [Bacillota bacterium]
MKFSGYRRPDGRAGVRNHVLILPTVSCSCRAAAGIASLVRGCVTFSHQHGCAQVGADKEQTFRTLVGLGAHPNVYGTIVVGLGCEVIEPEAVRDAIRDHGKPVQMITVQEAGGTIEAIARGARLAAEMAIEASTARRAECPVSDLILGTECGGSDACSGLSANPALGHACDALSEHGATIILAETTELIGAEHLLAQRACTPSVAGRCVEIVKRIEDGAFKMGVDMRGTQPSPGNIRGGITTIEEKSLGCIHKAGKGPVNEVIEYAGRPTRKGIVVMDTPGMDVDQLVGMVAGGAQIVVFTTGRGNPLGSPIVPVIKVASNSGTFSGMRDNMDINAGTIVEGPETVASVGDAIAREVLAVCDGKLTRSEVLGHDEFGIYRIGPTL